MYTFTFTEKFSKQENFNILKSGGIYKITCKSNGSFYIGQSSLFLYRFGNHRRSLERDIHCNKRVQSCFNKYGVESFIIDILDIVTDISKETLTEKEQHYVDTLNPDLNLYRVIESSLGYKFSEEQKKACVIAQRNNKTLNSKNVSGHRGICFDKESGKYNPHISVASKSWSLGFYETIEEALQVRSEAEQKYWSDDFDNLSKDEKIRILNLEKTTRRKNRKNLNPRKFIYPDSKGRFQVVIHGKYMGSSMILKEALQMRDKFLELETSAAEAS